MLERKQKLWCWCCERSQTTCHATNFSVESCRTCDQSKKTAEKTTLQVLIPVLQVAATCDQSKKQQEKTTLQVLISSFFLLRQPLLRVFKVLFFYRLYCWRQQWKNKKTIIRRFSRSRSRSGQGIAGFTEQRTAFTRAHSVQRVLKIHYPRS